MNLANFRYSVASKGRRLLIAVEQLPLGAYRILGYLEKRLQRVAPQKSK